MLPGSSASHRLRVGIFTVVLLMATCAVPRIATAQKTQSLLASAARLSEYVIQGAVNDERLEYLLQNSGSSKNQQSQLRQALAEQNAAWSALLDRIKHWKPTPEDLQQHVPQQLTQLVSLAHSSLLQSVGTLKKSHQYAWLASRLVSSLAEVNTLQARLKAAVAPEQDQRAAARPPTK
jgi:uncharacterized protein YhaN